MLCLLSKFVYLLNSFFLFPRSGSSRVIPTTHTSFALQVIHLWLDDTRRANSMDGRGFFYRMNKMTFVRFRNTWTSKWDLKFVFQHLTSIKLISKSGEVFKKSMAIEICKIFEQICRALKWTIDWSQSASNGWLSSCLFFQLIWRGYDPMTLALATASIQRLHTETSN